MPKIFAARTAWLTLAFISAALIQTVSAQTAPSMPPTMSAADFDTMFQALSNWGRWGADDQRGTLNLVTPAKRIQAAGLVREGISISLSQNLAAVQEANPGNQMQMTMTVQPGSPVAMDEVKIFYHGLTYAHMDALCHARYKEQAYNGFAASDAEASGCVSSGIEHLKDGVLSRGIIVDIPRLKGVPWLEPGTPVLASDIEAWEKSVGITIGSGDVVLVRTGRWADRGTAEPGNLQRGSPGVHVTALTLIRERDVAALGTDVGLDVIPTGVEGVQIPTHTIAIASIGLLIIDNADLEALAETAARLNRHEFMFSMSPIPVAGGTGSVVNAIATF